MLKKLDKNRLKLESLFSNYLLYCLGFVSLVFLYQLFPSNKT